MELEIQNGKVIKVDFQNREMRNKGTTNIFSSEEQAIYINMQNFRFCGDSGGILIDLKSNPEIIQAIRKGELNINGTHHTDVIDKSFDKMLDINLKLKLKGIDPNKMDISELLSKDVIDLSELMNIAVPFKSK